MSRKLRIERLVARVPASDGLQFPANPGPFSRYADSLRELVVACLHTSEMISDECPFSWDPYEQRFTFMIERWESVAQSGPRDPMMIRHRFHLATKDNLVADEVDRFRAELARWRTVADKMLQAAAAAHAAINSGELVPTNPS